MEATSSVTFSNPYLPTIGRLLEVLQHICATGGQRLTNRRLADLALCSPGDIPGALRRLEADGYIRRIDGLIELSISDRDSDHTDRTFDHHDRDSDHVAPQPAERSPMRRTPQPGHDRDFDPPHTPHKVYISKLASLPQLARDLVTEGVDPALAEQIAAAAGNKSLTEFRQQVALAERLGKRSPLGLVATLWARGQDLTTPPPRSHSTETRRDPASRPPLPRVQPRMESEALLSMAELAALARKHYAQQREGVPHADV